MNCPLDEAGGVLIGGCVCSLFKIAFIGGDDTADDHVTLRIVIIILNA